jgi:hypothetical protein
MRHYSKKTNKRYRLWLETDKQCTNKNFQFISQCWSKSLNKFISTFGLLGNKAHRKRQHTFHNRQVSGPNLWYTISMENRWNSITVRKFKSHWEALHFRSPERDSRCYYDREKGIRGRSPVDWYSFQKAQCKSSKVPYILLDQQRKHKFTQWYLCKTRSEMSSKFISSSIITILKEVCTVWLCVYVESVFKNLLNFPAYIWFL